MEKTILMSTRREIDRLVKDKVKEFSIEYDNNHWKAMESLLDKESKHQKVGVLYWLILGFTVLSFGLFVLFDQNNSVSKGADATELAQIQEANRSNTYIEKIAIRESDGSDHLMNDENASTTHTGNSPNSGFNRNDGISSLEKQSDIVLRNEDLTLNHAPGVSNEQGEADEFSQAKRIESAGLHPIASLTKEGLESLPYEKPWKKLWTLGIGWQVENSWGWSTGAFASLGLRLHETISIRFRPGFTLRSDNSLPTESYKQVQYDFGRTDIEGEISKLESYAVDVPLSVQLHKQRHILSVGGGIHYAFMQRVSITEQHFSNFSSLTNSTTPFFENVEQRKAWVQPNETLYPFAELYYSYLLTPTFELGGRSRFYIPEDLGISNRLNFAAQLVWYIN